MNCPERHVDKVGKKMPSLEFIVVIKVSIAECPPEV